MLQLKNICKSYKTGDLVQKALDEVSLNFRDNEFVSILGPSGSGKSTLLNIIGGLDQYDSGELSINGVSTKKYRNEDWDSYRNHTIGFVFQSYNLISHQTILANVELALTISGISRAKRKEMALDALDKVGLKNQAHKKPNQLSGGQMQRVAIARALVNNPSIVLADEPTGALDSETSIQVMNLLKEVAKDKLVIMVTHNPNLANEYSTRIVELQDGRITSDTNPYRIRKVKEAIHKNFGKASMSYLTSVSLSFNNLKTKARRTFMVAFAGSIGIIGISLILGLANGVNKFIADTEEETMLSYPIQITTNSFSMTSNMSNMFQEKKSNDGDINELKTLENMLSLVNQNDLLSLKQYFDKDGKKIINYSTALEYKYQITPIIYTKYEDNYIKVNPNESFSSLGLSSNNILFSNYSINAFDKLPKNERLYKDKYSLKYGSWPKNENECVIITNLNGGLSDFIFYSLGLRDNKELEKMIEDFANNRETSVVSDDRTWKYEDIINREFKVLSSSKVYKYDNKNNVYIDVSNDEKYIDSALENASTIKVVGIASPNTQNDATLLRMGIYYTDDLIQSLINEASNSNVVKAQQNNKEVNVLTNGPFGEKQKTDLDFTKLFTIDQKKIVNAFKINQSKIKMDTTSLTKMDFTKYLKQINLSNIDIDYLKKLNIKINKDNLSKLVNDITSGYIEYASSKPETDYEKLPNAINEYLNSEECKKILSEFYAELLTNFDSEIISDNDIENITNDIMSNYQKFIEDNNYNDPNKYNEYLMEYLRSDKARQLINSKIRNILNKMKDNININSDSINKLSESLKNGYIEYASKNNKPDPTKLSESFLDYLNLKETKSTINDGIYKSINVEEIMKQISNGEKNSKNSISKQLTKIINEIGNDIGNNIKNMMIKTMKNLPSAISIDANNFASAFKMNLTEEEIKSFINAMVNNSKSSYDNNMRKFGYAGKDDVSEIDIYPKNFESKKLVMQVLDEYNDEMIRIGEPSKSITYTDLVGTMLSSVTTIVNVISYVLIAFVAISLVVSSIMIGVITYISVLERRKEIGVLRAIGASKRNISEVFNAETGIIGLFAGLLGVIISNLLFIPTNIILRNITNIKTLTAYLKPNEIITLVLISVILTLIGGLIPSRSAANQNPVDALRTE